MNTKSMLRLLLVVGTVGASSGLVAYSTLGMKHQVGPYQVNEATFTKLTHEGFIVRGADGKLGLLEGYIIKDGEAVWPESSRLMSTPASYGAGQMIAANTVAKSTVKKPAVKTPPASKAPAPKKTAPKKAPKKPACPT